MISLSPLLITLGLLSCSFSLSWLLRHLPRPEALRLLLLANGLFIPLLLFFAKPPFAGLAWALLPNGLLLPALGWGWFRPAPFRPDRFTVRALLTTALAGMLLVLLTSSLR